MEEFSFEDSPKDWKYVYKYLQHRHLGWWLHSAFAWTGWFLGLGFVQYEPRNPAAWVIVVLSLLLLRSTFADGPTMKSRGQLLLSLDDDKLRLRSSRADCTYNSLERVVRTKKALVLYVNPYSAVLLPYKACRDKTQYERAEQIARGLIKK